MFNIIQAYVNSLEQPRDQHLILMMDHDELVYKQRSEVSRWTLLKAKCGYGPASFRSVCAFINQHHELLNIGQNDPSVTQVFKDFENKVRLYNTRRICWKRAHLLPFPAPLYNLDAVIAKIQELSRTLLQQGKRLALFIGRTTDEPLPQEENVEWASLDVMLGSYTDPSRLHLQMDFNDRARMGKIQKLFDKVVIDPSVIKGFKEDPWRDLGKLLRPTPDATLITETHAGFFKVTLNPTELEEQPDAPHAYICKGVNPQDEDQCIARYYVKAQDYLKSLYREVEFVQDQPYPYAKEGQERVESYFVLKNPWQSRLLMHRVGQEIRTQNGTLPND